METIETPRLRLEPLATSHFDALAAVYRDPEVARHLLTRPASREAFAAVFDNAMASAGTLGMWAVVDVEDDRFAGRVGFFPYGEPARPELAFLLAPACWGRGLATEACVAALRFGFARHGWGECIALVHPDNAGARRVCTKLGMALEGTTTIHGADVQVLQVSAEGFAAAVR